MKASTLTISAREQSRDYANLAELDKHVFALLTENGPVFRPGSVLVTEEVFETVLPVCVWTALGLHECGKWGACEPNEIAENDRAIIHGGSVVSRWFDQDANEFNIESTLEVDHTVTTVLVPTCTAITSDLGLSVIRLGDVVIDGSLYSVPLNQIWFALREHEMGSPGNTDLFARRGSFPAGSTAVSWWAHPFHPCFAFQPFWIVTHVVEHRVTSVFAGFGC